jgi:hypothetical protein
MQQKIFTLLLEHLYSQPRGPKSPSQLVADFTNSVCTAYRILTVIKAVEPRAIALGEAPTSKASGSDTASKDNSTATKGEARAVAPGDVSSSKAFPLDPTSKDDINSTVEVSLAGWRTISPAGMLAELAWDAHRESYGGSSYSRMCHRLLTEPVSTLSQPPPPRVKTSSSDL